MRRAGLLALVLAAAGAATGATFVLSIGIEKHDDDNLTPVLYAAADARAVADRFLSAGVPAANVTVLGSDATDPARRPTRNNLVAALEALCGRAQPQDQVVVFFAGHGVEVDGRQYLLAVDTRQRFVANTALPVELMREVLAGLQARQVLFLIDACRNDVLAGRGDQDAALTDGLARGLRPVLRGGDEAVSATLWACDVGQRAWGDALAKHGAFTRSLLAGLDGSAVDADGLVRLRPLAEYVRADVTSWAERNGRRQDPRLEIEGPGNPVVLQPGRGPLQPAPPTAPVVRPAECRVGEVRQAQQIAGFTADPEYGTLILTLAPEQLPTLATEVLRRWVEAGGRVVVSNSCATLFGFTVTQSPGEGEFVLAVKADWHPLIQDVARVHGDWAPLGMAGMGGGMGGPGGPGGPGRPAVTPLLCTGVPEGGLMLLVRPATAGGMGPGGMFAGAGAAQQAPEALVAVCPLGRGEVVFWAERQLKAMFDKAALERNWTRYIATRVGTLQPQRRGPYGPVGELWQPAAITQFIGDRDYHTLLIRCPKARFTDSAARLLRAWVDEGHRAVVTGDAAELFGFTGGGATTGGMGGMPGMPGGIGGVSTGAEWSPAVTPDAHPLIAGVSRLTSAQQGPMVANANWLATGHPTGQGLIVNSASNRHFLLAVTRSGKGEVLFRADLALADAFDKAAFERNWTTYLATAPAP